MTLPIFPDLPGMEWGNTKTPSFDVVVQKSGSKRRKTLSTHAYPEWELECSFTALDKTQIDKIAGFFMLVHGQLKSFRWLDMEDFKQAGVLFGIGDGVTQRFQLVRSWADLFYEPIYDVVDGTLIVFEGETRSAVTLEDDAVVCFAVPPADGVKLYADFHYYWRVAFPEGITWQIIWFNLYKWNSFKLEVAR